MEAGFRGMGCLVGPPIVTGFVTLSAMPLGIGCSSLFIPLPRHMFACDDVGAREMSYPLPSLGDIEEGESSKLRMRIELS